MLYVCKNSLGVGSVQRMRRKKKSKQTIETRPPSRIYGSTDIKRTHACVECLVAHKTAIRQCRDAKEQLGLLEKDSLKLERACPRVVGRFMIEKRAIPSRIDINQSTRRRESRAPLLCTPSSIYVETTTVRMHVCTREGNVPAGKSCTHVIHDHGVSRYSSNQPLL